MAWRRLATAAAIATIVARAEQGEELRHGEISRHSHSRRTLMRKEEEEESDGTGAFASDDFSKTCKPYPGKRLVLVAVDKDFVDFFDNWLGHASKFLSSDEQVVAIADTPDVEPLLEKLKKRRSQVHFDVQRSDAAAPAALLEGDTVATPFGTMGYNNLMHSRPRHLLRYLEQGCSVLYVDVDTAWLRSPFEDIKAAGKHDLYVVDDGQNAPGGPIAFWKEEMAGEIKSGSMDCKTKRPNFCGCFMYVHPTHQTVEFAQEWHNTSTSGAVKNEGNQQAYNWAVCHQVKAGISLGVLPYQNYPPGPSAKKATNPIIVHANWLAGHDVKQKFMQELGHWNLSSPL